MTDIDNMEQARRKFLLSTVTLLEIVEASNHRFSRLIAGRGSRKRIPERQRSAIYRHWAVLADLRASGHGWAINNEIEGIVSCIEIEGARGALSTIKDVLAESYEDEEWAA